MTYSPRPEISHLSRLIEISDLSSPEIGTFFLCSSLYKLGRIECYHLLVIRDML